VRQGGCLLIDAESGTCDLLDLQRRPPFAELGVTPVNATPPLLRSGKGAIVLINSFEELVPQREYAFVDALDVRDNKSFVDRIKDIGARALDTEAQNRFHQWFTSLAGTEVTLAEGARDVHTVAYERLGDHEGALVIHAVHYAAATWGDEPSVVQPAPLKLVIPLPSGWELQRASVRQPEKPAVLADVRMNSNRAHCEIPAFEFYSMLHLELKRTMSKAAK
jgi:hypothetical protein